jgi:hypothetical protein
MIVDIELTRRTDGRYVARALHLPDVVVEAASRDAALEQMRDALVARQQSGVEIVRLDIGDAPGAPVTTWPPLSGAFPDDAVYREMLAEVERYRRELDQEPAA